MARPGLTAIRRALGSWLRNGEDRRDALAEGRLGLLRRAFQRREKVDELLAQGAGRGSRSPPAPDARPPAAAPRRRSSPGPAPGVGSARPPPPPWPPAVRP